MATTQGAGQPTFRVLDAMDAPHGGRIVRLRLQTGEAPRIGALKGARLKATSADGRTSTTLQVRGFAVFGGRPSDERLSRTGRIDLHVDEVSGPPVGLRWEVRQD